MIDNKDMCKVITSGYCPYADGVDEDVKSCADCPWYNPEAEQRFFEEVTRMADREKVITGLECCSVKQSCSGCPWMGIDCNDRLHLAALELLKEQEPVKPVVNVDEWVCGCCGLSVEQQRMIHPSAIFHDFFEYCPHCGKKVDWEAVKQDD